MDKEIQVSNETYRIIQDLKRMWIEQTGRPINDDDAIRLGVGLFLKIAIAPPEGAYLMFEAQIAEHRIRKDDFES